MRFPHARQLAGRNALLVSCTCAFFVTFFARVAISPVVPFVTSDLRISNTHVGFALSGMWIAYGLSQYPSGKLAERLGERRVILLAVGGTAGSSVVTALAPGFGLFVVGVVGIGALAGLHYTAASAILSRTYDNVGTALGVHSLGAPAAGLVAPVLAAWIGTRYGWRPAVALVVLVAVPVLALVRRSGETRDRDRPAERRADREASDTFAAFLTRPEIAVAAVVAVTGIFTVNGLVSFLPTLLVAYHDFSPTLAGVVFSVFFVARGATQLGVGALSDRVNREGLTACCFAVGAVGLGALGVASGSGAVVGAVLLSGVGVSFLAALEPAVLDSLDEAERGAGFGVFRTVLEVGSAAGPVAVGAAADLFGWGVAISGLAALFGISVVLVGALGLARRRSPTA